MENFFAGKDCSLQENFKRFLSERRRQIREINVKAKEKSVDRSSAECQQALRLKFVERAMRYIGVPYSKKYCEPGTPAFSRGFFLDCCGLVRQALDDLKEDFGFRAGRWNQAYQYDTLLPEIAFEAMKPGDLIFYSGTYFEPKKRRQIHDMVHVEIFLGGETGEKSLGSRWVEGCVALHDSYKFTSTKYYDVKFHYMSIDLWLRGVCASQCQTHPWNDDRGYQWLTHKSIFAQEQEDEDGVERKLDGCCENEKENEF